MARVDTNSILGFREKSLYPLATRLQRRWFALVGNRLPRSQRLYLVTINGQRFKRLVLPDAHYAASIAANLREFGADEIYPSLLIEREAADFQAYMPFVELCFLGFWVKSSFLERKKRFIDPGLFERFLREWNSG